MPSAPLLASTTSEGVATIDASSSGNLVNPLSSSLLISFENLGQNSLHLNSSSPSSSPNTCLLDSNSLLPYSSPVEQTIGQTENSQNPNAQILSNPLVQRLHQMTTRSMNKFLNPNNSILCLNIHSLRPLNQPWRDAMSSELTTLMKLGTWDLVPIPLNCNPVGCKWVLRVKRKPDGSGYNQCPDLDYKKTFSPRVKPATIRTALSIIVVNDIYDATPGFKDPSKPNHVCRLKKVIYGLKQALRAWYTTLKNVLLELGFDSSRADSSLFIYRKDFIIHYFLVYVDDIVIIGNNKNFDMGLLHFFLGVEVVPTQAGLFLSQHKYIRELLSNTNMSGAKDVSTPLSTTQSLKLLDGTTNVDNIEFRRIIGSLQYLSLTHPDISFAVNKLSQFMHKPTTTHFTAKKKASLILKANHLPWYTTHKIWTSSFNHIFRCPNPISWSLKKQRSVARSTTEAEYRALANATSETMWLLGLLHYFNPVQHSHMKHIQIDLHFVRDLVQCGSLQVRHVHTQDQLVDLLTKPLSRQKTEMLRYKIGLADGSSILRV
ncbi:hypothetical protein AAG906_033149 [Vitis piasezkii]